MAERSLELKRLGEAVADRYRELKQTAGVLDFDDLQQHTLRLLRESGPPVRAAICSPIRLVLVDEFQDTDRVQAEILEHLRSKSGASLVAVGDVKQSIYGFRGARPQLFEALNRSVPAHDRHQLTENFRSVPKIVHFINSLFENVFEGSDYHLLSKRREPARQYETPVLLNPCHALLDSKTPVETRRAIEARAIAQYVALVVPHDQGY
jgi:ATP-dependent helicase/nuclease subunit A